MNMLTGIILAVLLAIGAVCGLSYISAANTGNRMEQSMKAISEDNKNVLAQYGNKITEAAQIPAMYRDDVINVATAAIEGRYGADGSKALFQAISEQNPTLDSTVYVQLQQMIEAGRNEFREAQTRLVDQKRVYQTSLGSFWSGTWMGIAGYPKLNFDDYVIVSTDRDRKSVV